MKVIDRSLVRAEDDLLKKIQGHLQGVSKFGLAWEAEMRAQEIVVQQMSRLLDNRFVMLRNFTLPGTEVIIPLILVGPPGVVVVNARGDQGVYRARGDSWTQLEGRTRQYQSASRNPILQTVAYTKAVEEFFTSGNLPPVEVQDVLIFSHPGAHVDSSRPTVRIVLVDALEHYISGLLQSNQVLSGMQVQAVVEGFEASPVEAEPEPPKEPARTSRLPQTGVVADIYQGKLPASLNRVSFSKRQWVLLAVMAVLDILVLIALIFVVLWLS